MLPSPESSPDPSPDPSVARRFRAIVAYDGARFHGWQFQPGLPTVQGEIEAAIYAVTGARPRVDGAGRTDQGVHALGQVAAFTVATRLGAERLRLALNHHLPADVRLLRCQEASPRFSPRFDAHWRMYWYLLAREATPFTRGRAYTPWFWPEVERMNTGLQFLLGEWDFNAYTVASEGPYSCRIHEAHWDPTADGLRLTIRANRFLYRMVRIIVGTSIRVGTGRLRPEAMGEILGGGDRRAAGRLAPAEGLYLAHVEYGDDAPTQGAR